MVKNVTTINVAFEFHPVLERKFGMIHHIGQYAAFDTMHVLALLETGQTPLKSSEVLSTW